MATNRIGLRHDTNANWTSNNPTLVTDETVIVDDERKVIRGDGSAYNTSFDTVGYMASHELESDTAWTSATSLLNDWTGTVYYIKRAGMVTITAILDGTSASDPVILTLSTDYRPDHSIRGTGRNATSVAVSSTGDITANTGNDNVWFTFTYPVI